MRRNANPEFMSDIAACRQMEVGPSSHIRRYMEGEITSEEYFAAVNQEVAEELRKDFETVGGDFRVVLKKFGKSILQLPR